MYQRHIRTRTGPEINAWTWLRECFRHVEAGVVSNRRIKLHQTTYKIFFSPLYCTHKDLSLAIAFMVWDHKYSWTLKFGCDDANLLVWDRQLKRAPARRRYQDVSSYTAEGRKYVQGEHYGLNCGKFCRIFTGLLTPNNMVVPCQIGNPVQQQPWDE